MAFAVPELISGASVISRAASAIPTLILYGAGVVFIRELSRRNTAGLVCAALLGVAYALVEEGEALGLLFRPARQIPWASRTGLVVAGVLWLAAAAVIGHFFRTHLLAGALPATILLLATAGLALAVAAAAVMAGRGPANAATPGRTAKPPSPVWVGAVALALAGAWVGIGHIPEAFKAYPLAFVPLTAELLLATLAWRLFRRWPNAAEWTDVHTAFALWALIIVEIAQGARYVASMGVVDRLGQLAAGLAAAAVVLLGLLKSRQGDDAPVVRNVQGVS
jgi:hypothetical protein